MNSFKRYIFMDNFLFPVSNVSTLILMEIQVEKKGSELQYNGTIPVVACVYNVTCEMHVCRCR